MSNTPRRQDSATGADLVDVLVSPTARNDLDFASVPIHGAVEGSALVTVFAAGHWPGRASRVTVLVGGDVRTRIVLASRLLAFNCWVLLPLTVIAACAIGVFGPSTWPDSLLSLAAVILVLVVCGLIASVSRLASFPQYPRQASGGWIRLPRVERQRAETWLSANPADRLSLAEPIVRSKG